MTCCSSTIGTHNPTSVMPAEARIHPSRNRAPALPLGKTAAPRRPGWIPAFAGMTNEGVFSYRFSLRGADPIPVMPAEARIHPSRNRAPALPLGETAAPRRPGWIPAFAGMTSLETRVSSGVCP